MTKFVLLNRIELERNKYKILRGTLFTAIDGISYHIVLLYRQQKLWSSGRALGSGSEGRGFDPHPMLDGSGVKAMPGSIPVPSVLHATYEQKENSIGNINLSKPKTF